MHLTCRVGADKLSSKGQTDILGFADPVVSITTTQLCCYSLKTVKATGLKKKRVWVCPNQILYTMKM